MGAACAASAGIWGGKHRYGAADLAGGMGESERRHGRKALSCHFGRQNLAILYACAGKVGDSGEITLKCTIGTLFLARFASNVLKTSRKPCPRVQNNRILPKSRVLSARAYKIVKFCHRACSVASRTPPRPERHRACFVPRAAAPSHVIPRAAALLHAILRRSLHDRPACRSALYFSSRLMPTALPLRAFLVVARRRLIIIICSSIPYFCGEGYLAGRIGVP